MRHPIRIQILDHQSVLSNDDQHQVLNMIWLRLAPIKEKIDSVKFKITRLKHDNFAVEHLVELVATLKSGYRVETTTTRISKGAALIASADQMKSAIESRVRTESGSLHAMLEFVKKAIRGISGSNDASYRAPRNNCSHSAS